MEALTADDFYALPDTPERYELLEGMLVMAPPPGGTHQTIQSWLVHQLWNFAEGVGGVVLGSPTGVQLGTATVFGPDVLYIPAEQASLLEDRGVRGGPALVIEIASPSTRRYDISTKLPAYLDAGVREVWIVDPVAKTTSVHRPGQTVTTVPFGQPIASAVVEVGTAGLERFTR
jgi:Uma2 family endonuclease